MAGILALSLVGLVACVDAVDTTDAIGPETAALEPRLACVFDDGGPSLEAVLGYANHADRTVHVAVGPHNRLRDRGHDGDRGDDHPHDRSHVQPTYFLPGDHDALFSVRFQRGDRLIWRLGGTKLVATASSPACPIRPDTGARLFEQETFGGNGRTCRTCHGAATGTISPADVAARPVDDPVFRFDGLDDFRSGTTRVRAHATILVPIPLPSNVRLADDPTARSVVVARGVPTTINTPGLDPVLMLDGRAPNLQAQAASAIAGHAQSIRAIPPPQLDRIAAFEQLEQAYSSRQLAELFFFGAPPALPSGATDSERRGRVFFVDRPLGPNLEGACAICHSGPLLNQTNEFLQDIIPGDGPGLRFFNINVNDFNVIGNPVRSYIVTLPDHTTTTVTTPDPGRGLITGELVNFNQFKIPSLWNTVRTAPYFHDNSAGDLDAMLDHYDRYFELALGKTFTPRQRADIKAYLQLLE